MEDLQYEWLQNNNVVDKKKYSGNTLTQVAKTVEKDSFRCKVSNKVSSMVSEAVEQTCFKPGEYRRVVTIATRLCDFWLIWWKSHSLMRIRIDYIQNSIINNSSELIRLFVGTLNLNSKETFDYISAKTKIKKYLSGEAQ